MKYKYIIVLLIIIPSVMIGQAEICDNGKDDDNDNLIDLNDDDCHCVIVEPLSLIPNPSFEEMDCCPDDRSQLDCASDWIQASQPTTDLIHLCNWLGWPQFPPPQPFPDGEGIIGLRDGRVRSTNNPEANWKEYAGACLINPLLKDSSYRFQFDVGFVNSEFSPPINITFFGTSSCAYLPFGKGDNAFGCPTNSPEWIKLGHVRVSGGTGNSWINTSIDIVPQKDIYAMAIGPDCKANSSEASLYYFLDNLLLTNLAYFDLQISEVFHPCDRDFTLSIPYNPELEYQWYLSGVALEGEVLSKLSKNYGEGAYQVRILDEESCRISANYEYIIPSYNTIDKIAICEGEFYDFYDLRLTDSGLYLDTILTKNNCDSIVAVELEVKGEKYDTIMGSILEGEIFEVADHRFEDEGDYPLTFTSSIGCDSLVLLKLSNFNIYIPSVFSPNYNTLNDKFYPIAAEGNIKSVDMQIFDRWGNLIFQGSEWDGSNQEPNLYVYRINIEFEFKNSKIFYGSITLLN